MYTATVNGATKLQFLEECFLSQLLVRSGEYIQMPCGANASCGKCKVIATGCLSPLTEKEKQALTPKEIAQGYRLACVCKALGDVNITAKAVPPEVMVDISSEEIPYCYDRTDGLVIDIGTTTVAAILYQKKKPVRIITEENRQVTCGADVISRIAFDKDHPGMAGNLLQEQIKDILAQCEFPKNTVIVANTTMLHFLTGQSVASLGETPYTPQDLFGKTYPLFGHSCYLAPCVSAFVGGDITAGILASRMLGQNETALLVDFGTNGELVLFDKQHLYTTSTAAGPALEGAGIFQGMPAGPGAIDHVSYQNGQLTYTTIQNTLARGICGSGIVDLLAVMSECGALDESGSLNPDHPFCKRDHHGKICFAIPQSDVILRASDIRKLQLAKAAIHAGMLTLADKADTLYIAGGFGSRLNPKNAERIGLLPKGFSKQLKVLGNTALQGGTMALFSDEARQQLEEIAHRCQTVALHNNPTFTNLYLENMTF